MGRLFVHPHALSHGLRKSDIKHAWRNFVVSQPRRVPHENQIVRIGFARSISTPIQMIGAIRNDGVLIYHALTPPQKSVLDELGIKGGK